MFIRRPTASQVHSYEINPKRDSGTKTDATNFYMISGKINLPDGTEQNVSLRIYSKKPITSEEAAQMFVKINSIGKDALENLVRDIDKSVKGSKETIFIDFIYDDNTQNPHNIEFGDDTKNLPKGGLNLANVKVKVLNAGFDPLNHLPIDDNDLKKTESLNLKAIKQAFNKALKNNSESHVMHELRTVPLRGEAKQKEKEKERPLDQDLVSAEDKGKSPASEQKNLEAKEPIAQPKPKQADIKAVHFLPVVLDNMERANENHTVAYLSQRGVITPEDMVLSFRSYGITTNELLKAVKEKLDHPLTEDEIRYFNENTGTRAILEKNKLISNNTQKYIDFTLKLIQTGLYTDDLSAKETIELLSEISHSVVQSQDENVRKAGAQLSNAILGLMNSEPPQAAQKASPNARTLDSIMADVRKGKNFDKNANLIASELKLINLEDFPTIQLSEFLNYNGNEKNIDSFPNIAKLNEKSNNLTGWVVRSIIDCDENQRKNVLKFFIELTNKSIENGDFNSALMIYAAINSSPIRRLNNLKKGFESEIQALNKLFSPSNSFGNLKEKMKSYQNFHKGQPVIPPLNLTTGPIMVSMEHPSLPKIKENTFNVDRGIKIASILRNNYISFVKHNPKDHSSQQHVINVGDELNKPYDEDNLYKASQKIEPMKEQSLT